ncbi:Cytochrome c oxidase biogenesis protein Cmc1-like protein [Ascosphaera apis ARSEF 7405]|uniref:COX assembly mitochondrial protein n=1 Tax=Ascosphaera apis ARSEF 7405 TaxID=392613 RepID=A0A167Z0G6_9EURO|nr:Cytochrome c oxidase biogenesis protein Cmc1-like protein [Ascosphaera apis ARSEF 7405]
MHSHLHTPQNINCEEIMTALDECHAKGFLYKAVGGCNDVKREVNRCLGQERRARVQRNNDSGLKKRKEIEKLWSEADQSAEKQ